MYFFCFKTLPAESSGHVWRALKRDVIQVSWNEKLTGQQYRIKKLAEPNRDKDNGMIRCKTELNHFHDH